MAEEPIHNNLKVDLLEAVHAAQLLLTYATEKGLTLDQNDVKTLVQAKHFLQTTQWTPEFETEFWLAFKNIATLVKPVTVDSLKDIAGAYIERSGVLAQLFGKKQKISAAKQIVKHYRVLAFVVLAFMLVVQIYWVIGSVLITDNTTLQGQIQELSTKKYTLEQIDTKAGRAAADNREIQEIERQIIEIQYFIEANDESLVIWNRLWQFLFSPFTYLFHPSSNATETSAESTESTPSKRPTLAEIASKNKEKTIKTIRYRKNAQFVLEALRSYLLPLLYGSLGALAYVLRRLSSQIKTMTYTTASNINYRLRIQLGLLAGLAIGWFYGQGKPETAISISSLSPLALAFLAGYSVEMLFTIMDGLISTVSKKENT